MPLQTAAEPGLSQPVESLIQDLSVEFSSILDLDELIERVARRIREVISYSFFNLLLVDEERGGLVWKKSVGYKPEEMQRLGFIPYDHSIAGAAVLERQTIIVNDLREDPRNLRAETEGNDEPRSEIAVPLRLARENRVVGVLTMESTEPNHFTPEHARLLGVLSNHLAIALEHARLYDELRQRTSEMETLIEIGREISSILDFNQLINNIAPLLRRVIDYEYLLVGLIDEGSNEFVWHVEEGYGLAESEAASRTRVSQGIVGRAVRERRTMIVGDVTRDPDYHVNHDLPGRRRSEIAVPLCYEDQMLGVIALESSRRNAFSRYHAGLLENIANHLSIAIVNARLYTERVERERRLEREILMARDVQRAMIPDGSPAMKGFDIAARLEPALNLSGDFYDFVKLSDKRLALMIGDVAGKGVRAAMGMAAVRSIVRNFIRSNAHPTRVLRSSNTRLHRDLGRQLLVTLVYGVLDAETRTFQYCNAGHNAPILVRPNGKWRALKAGGLLLGVFDKQQYKSETLHLERGDLLFFYTDGLNEAHTPAPDRIEFGEKRLIEFLVANRHLKANALADAVITRIREFSEGAHQHDDLTLMVVKAG
ncbi:MAG TPA: GAF domain-containing SpoIIE family protein phosphatase [Blastocatellia bacterium]|nr:GAF domain-containing SpoIIE family protein phosphatase [Blastocatellia bacterium]